MKILVLNAGSSSQKSQLYELTREPTTLPVEPLWSAEADWSKTSGQTEITLSVHGQHRKEILPTTSRTDVITTMLTSLWTGEEKVIESLAEITVVGHRIVHGGADYRESTRITPPVLEAIRRMEDFAPLHNKANLEGIEAITALVGEIPQIAVFDTAFHTTISAEVSTYPGPYEWIEKGIRRYGFHGTSHKYCATRSAEILQRANTFRLVNCHLGNGASLAAIRNGKSVDTTMGFTPLEGVMMGTRSGTVDPGILLYLLRDQQITACELDTRLNKEAGLKGISGLSGDMRQIEKAIGEGNTRARLAYEIYLYRLRYFIGAMAASLGGIDALAFTGGIGENDAQIRARTCADLAFLGIRLDEQKNSAHPIDIDIATPESAVRILVIHTEEDWEIARECWQKIQVP